MRRDKKTRPASYRGRDSGSLESAWAAVLVTVPAKAWLLRVDVLGESFEVPDERLDVGPADEADPVRSERTRRFAKPASALRFGSKKSGSEWLWGPAFLVLRFAILARNVNPVLDGRRALASPIAFRRTVPSCWVEEVRRLDEPI